MKHKRTTLSDIAQRLNVSMNTVNKALYGKKGVGEELRKKIQETAVEMNYQANRVAQSMARNPLLIGVLGSREWKVVGKDFKQGIDSVLAQLKDYNIYGKYYYISSHDNSKEIDQVIKKVAKDGVNALICNHVQLNANNIKMLESHNIPFAFLGTDMAIPQRLTCVRSDGKMAGRLAAELFAGMLPEHSEVVIMTNSRDYQDCEDKVQGMIHEAQKVKLNIVAVYEHQDCPETASGLIDTLLAEHPGVTGIYSATANSPSMCRRIVELGLEDRFKIVATDLYGDIRKYLRQGVIKVALHQDCVAESEKIVRLIYAHLCEGRDISTPVLIPPMIIMRNNLTNF